MRKWTQTIIEILNGFLIFSGLYCAVIRQTYENDLEIFISALMLLPIMILLSAGAHRAKYFFQYAICAVCAIVLAYISSALLWQKITMMIITVVIIISYFVGRAKHMECWIRKPEFAVLALFLVIYILAGRTDSNFLRFYACYEAGIYYLMISYYENAMEMDGFMRIHANLDRFPEKRLVKNNRRMMWIQAGCVAAAMFAAPFLGIDQLFYGIGNLLKKILVWILKGFKTEESTQSMGGETVQESQLILPGEAYEKPAWMEILSKFFEVLAYLFVLAVFVFILYKILKKLYEMYLQFGTRTEENGDKVERIQVTSTHEKTERNKVKKENLFWDRSINARIRKFYKKRIQKEMKEKVNPAWTPQEIERHVDMQEKEKAILHAHYEKARYSKADCTREELQEVSVYYKK